MIKNEAIKELVDKGIIESEEYYHDVKFNIFLHIYSVTDLYVVPIVSSPI